MKLTEMMEALAQERVGNVDQSLRNEVLDFAKRTIQVSTLDQKLDVWAKHIMVFLWLFFTAATGTIALGASVKFWSVDPITFKLVWGAFVVSFVPIVVKRVRAIWESG